jgi:hypothetical protein
MNWAWWLAGSGDSMGEKRAPRSGSGEPTGDGREKFGVRRWEGDGGDRGTPRSPVLGSSSCTNQLSLRRDSFC